MFRATLFVVYAATLVYGARRERKMKGETIKQPFPGVRDLKISYGQNQLHKIEDMEVYDIELRRIVDGDDSQAIKPPMLSLDNENYEDLNIKNECVGIPRHANIQALKSQILFDGEENYYTDMLSIKGHQNIYLGTEDLKLISVKLDTLATEPDLQPFQFNFKTFLNLSSDQDASLFLIGFYERKEIAVITKFGVYWFFDDDLNASTIFARDASFLVRDTIYAIDSTWEYLAVASSQEGCDLYSINFAENLRLKHLKTFTSSFFSEQNVEIVQVKVVGNKLYVLDELSGLYIISLGEAYSLIFFVKIPQGVAFDTYNNTVILVAESANNYQYVVELFLDFENVTYYVNRFFLDDFSFVDIEMTPKYAIIIGEDLHMVVRHSVFNGFIKENYEVIRYFYEEDLLRLDPYHGNIHYSFLNDSLGHHSYFISASTYGLKLWRFSDNYPAILCHFAYNDEVNYRIHANTSTCSLHPNYEPYRQCQITQDLHVIASGPILDSSHTYLIVIAAVSSVVFPISYIQVVLALIFVITFRKCRGHLTKLRALRKEKLELQKYSNFSEIEQSSMMINNPQ